MTTPDDMSMKDRERQLRARAAEIAREQNDLPPNSIEERDRLQDEYERVINDAEVIRQQREGK